MKNRLLVVLFSTCLLNNVWCFGANSTKRDIVDDISVSDSSDSLGTISDERYQRAIAFHQMARYDDAIKVFKQCFDERIALSGRDDSRKLGDLYIGLGMSFLFGGNKRRGKINIKEGLRIYESVGVKSSEKCVKGPTDTLLSIDTVSLDVDSDEEKKRRKPLQVRTNWCSCKVVTCSLLGIVFVITSLLFTGGVI